MEENKFNFSDEEEQKAQAVEETKEAVKKDAKGLIGSIKSFFSELLGFAHDTDRDATIEAIKGDIPLKGATAWILICSIFVASIGLNANSTAVVIGAMLISPLMGPILGIGLSLAINDIDTLRKSFVNFGVMIILSVLTAYLFFKFFPLQEDSSELLARTKPDIRDVLIAFFGGLALIIARTKKGTIASVIFGVAIATALMPPLCTVGFGLAKGGVKGLTYAGGAMYLFIINTVFIALATFLVLKILRFPMLKYANSAKRKRIARFASFVAVLVMIFPIMTFLKVLKETKFQQDYNDFIENKIMSNNDLWLQRHILKPETGEISLFFNGEVSNSTETFLNNELKSYANIGGFKLDINANETRSADRLSKSLDRAYNDLDRKDNVISGLQKQIEGLQEEVTNLNKQLEQKSNVKSSVSFTTLAKDAKIRFKDLEYFSYAKMLESKDFIKVDTVTVAHLKWNTKLTDSVKTIKEKELNNWLKKELKTKRIVLKRN